MMKSFSNMAYLKAITPKQQTTSSQTVMLLYISVAGLSVAAFVFYYKYRQQTEWMDSLRRQNLILSGKLEVVELAVAIPENINNQEEISQQTDN